MRSTSRLVEAFVGVARLERPLRRRSVKARHVVARHRRELVADLVRVTSCPARTDRPQQRDRRRPGPDADLDDARAGVDVAPQQDRADVLRVDHLRLAGEVGDQLRVGRAEDAADTRRCDRAHARSPRGGRSDPRRQARAPRTVTRRPLRSVRRYSRALRSMKRTASPSRKRALSDDVRRLSRPRSELGMGHRPRSRRSTSATSRQ